MSFASEAREEIVARSIQKECCVRAACYGVACFAKYFDARGLVFQTEQQKTAEYAKEMFARCGVRGSVTEKCRPSGTVYEFAIREPSEVAQMHALFGTTGEETSIQIDPALLRCRGCVSAYVGSAFLCSGTVTDPQKEYNLEVLTPRTNLARDFEALLAEHEFAPHRTRRKSINLIYVKASANVEALLAFMGAEEAARKIGSEKAVKSVRNQVNRFTNCETANLNKTVSAAVKQIEDIQYIQKTIGFGKLPENLAETARLRLEQPGLSLKELGQLLTPPVGKSGVNHRLRKLSSIAEELRDHKEERIL